MGIGAREKDPFPAQKSGQKLLQRGTLFEIGPHQCCIIVDAASGRFSHEIPRKIDKVSCINTTQTDLELVYRWENSFLKVTLNGLDRSMFVGARSAIGRR